MRLLICVLFPLFSFTQHANDLNNLSNDVIWVTESKEYKMLCQQIYNTATKQLKKQCKKNSNPVIIMDIDETVLDNSKYQVDLHIQNTSFNSKSWNNFVEEEISELVPGAKKFILAYKKYSNAKIIYISNRDASTLESTKSNMKKLGIFFEDDIFLLRENKSDSKIIRRQEVLDGNHRMKNYGPQSVIAYFGDAIGDFPKDKKYQFAKNKFLFPNPMYGEWKK
ncbi:MAG: hypothetical protein CMP49_06615 [Flavobacteriales bacterium]|nr:hypothetical protein [Flavobacteriales bacterium]|tara:strand:+ start:1666 stop:2334 length:669 start_codon:yes stop_codon:yes gene_type:complete